MVTVYGIGSSKIDHVAVEHEDLHHVAVRWACPAGSEEPYPAYRNAEDHESWGCEVVDERTQAGKMKIPLATMRAYGVHVKLGQLKLANESKDKYPSSALPIFEDGFLQALIQIGMHRLQGFNWNRIRVHVLEVPSMHYGSTHPVRNQAMTYAIKEGVKRTRAPVAHIMGFSAGAEVVLSAMPALASMMHFEQGLCIGKISLITPSPGLADLVRLDQTRKSYHAAFLDTSQTLILGITQDSMAPVLPLDRTTAKGIFNKSQGRLVVGVVDFSDSTDPMVDLNQAGRVLGPACHNAWNLVVRDMQLQQIMRSSEHVNLSQFGECITRARKLQIFTSSGKLPKNGASLEATMAIISILVQQPIVASAHSMTLPKDTRREQHALPFYVEMGRYLHDITAIWARRCLEA